MNETEGTTRPIPGANAAEPGAATPPPPPEAPTRAGETGWSTGPEQPGASSPWQARGATSAPTGPFGSAAPAPGSPGPPLGETTVLPTAEQPTPQKQGGRGRMLLAGVAIGAILGGGSGAAVVTWLDDSSADEGTRSSLVQDSNPPTGEPAASLEGVEAVAEQVLPSVVSITIGGQMGATGGGTGVIISSDGEILTNNHVVEAGGPGSTLQVAFSDGTTADAEVVGTDPLTDLAVIKAQDVDGLTPASLGASGDLSVGEQVVAIGSPLGLDGTVTSGIVSALQRPIITGEQQNSQTFIDAIQTDAPINRGNSGGPLVNMAGEVVGINSAIATSGADAGSIGLGFSIPIDQARPIVEELLESGSATHARIGIGVVAPQEQPGALVQQVEPNGSAAEAGIQEGDIITKINDRVVNDHISLIAAARSYRPGDEVTLTYLRDGEEHTAEITLGSDGQTT